MNRPSSSPPAGASRDTTDSNRAIAEGLDDHMTDLRERMRGVDARVRELVDQYPVASLALAAGIGFLLARLSQRR